MTSSCLVTCEQRSEVEAVIHFSDDRAIVVGKHEILTTSVHLTNSRCKSLVGEYSIIGKAFNIWRVQEMQTPTLET